jgi:hypothetical protein
VGYNTGVMILNDDFHNIQKKPDFFVERMIAAAAEFWNSKGKPIDFHTGGICNGGEVFWQEHADHTGVVAIGQNCTTLLHRHYGCHHTEEHKLNILRDMAKEMGYSLTKKRRQSSDRN